MVRLLLAHLQDTLQFVKHCWSDSSSFEESSHIPKQYHFLSKSLLRQFTQACEELSRKSQDIGKREWNLQRIENKLNVRLAPLSTYKSKEVKSLVKFLVKGELLLPFKSGVKNSHSEMTMRELREFLHYGVIRRRATLPYEVPLSILSKLLSSSLRI